MSGSSSGEPETRRESFNEAETGELAGNLLKGLAKSTVVIAYWQGMFVWR
jgi:hypothetical protein